MYFSKILSELRAEKGISQKELAFECDLSPQCISALELGTRNPTGSTIIALAKFFDCTTDYLLGLDGNFGAANSAASTPSELSPEELTLIKKYRALNPANKKYLNQTIEILSENVGRQKKID